MNTAKILLDQIPEYRNEVEDYRFARPSLAGDNDFDDFQYMIWEKITKESERSSSQSAVKLVVATMPVWILSPHDLHRVVWVNDLPTRNEIGPNQSRYNGAHRIWGKAGATFERPFILLLITA